MAIFIAIEGIDGAGKDTVVNGVTRKLREANIPTYSGAEPTSHDYYGARIRRILAKEEPFPEGEFQDLYMQDRKIHSFKIANHLRHGENYISARSWFSTLAYGMLTKPLAYWIARNHEIVGTGMVFPHVTFILDLPVSVALERIRHRVNDDTYFTKAATLEHVRKNYMTLYASQSLLGETRRISAELPGDIVVENVLSILKDDFGIKV